MSNSVYNKLVKFNGMDEIRKIVNQWETLSKNLETIDSDLPVLIPKMLWISKPGVGRTHLLRLISEYIFSKKNLMHFYGEVKYFEFLAGYCPPDQDFTELKRLIDTVQQAAGFRNEYKGIVFIDIDEWVGHEEEKHFITLLEYLSDNSDSWFIIFWVSPGCNAKDSKNESLQNIERILSMFFRIDKMFIPMPETKLLISYVKRYLANYKLTLDSNAIPIISKTIEMLNENKYFDGYHTLKILCQDMVYSVYTSKDPQMVITKKIASQFSEESEYIKRMVYRIKEKQTIGFGG